MSTAAILLPTQNEQFADLAKGLQLSFMELGWSCMWLGDKDHVREYAKDIDLAIVMTPFDYRDIESLLPKATKVLYQLEAMPWPTRIHFKRRWHWGWDKLETQIVPHYDVVWDFDEGNIKEHWKWYGRLLKKPIVHCPIGYSPAFELQKRVAERPIALFIGAVSNVRRQKHRHRTVRMLESKLGDTFATIRGRYGDKARQAAKNAMININIHQDIPILETHRIVGLLMSNKCFIITELCPYPGPFQHLEHYVVSVAHEIPAEVRYYLETSWERERIANNAYRFIKNHYTMTQHLGEALKQL